MTSAIYDSYQIDVANKENNNLIEIKNIEGALLVSSREVGINFEKEHAKVLRIINEKIEVNPILASPKYFIKSSYVDKSNRNSKEYLMTRDGFSFLVMGFTGSKADDWKLKYIEAFNQMEENIKNPYANMSKELQAIFMLDNKQQELENKVSNIESKMTVDYELAENLRTAVNSRAVHLLGNKHSEAYKRLSKKLFAEFYRDIKSAFKVNSYKNISLKNYDKALHYIEHWKPSEMLGLAIHGANNQVKFCD